MDTNNNQINQPEAPEGYHWEDGWLVNLTLEERRAMSAKGAAKIAEQYPPVMPSVSAPKLFGAIKALGSRKSEDEK